VKEYLDLLKVPYEEDHTLVRWLDYYTHTVWEFADNSWRSQDAFWWWGRYDGLSKKIWHSDEIPAVWFAFGIERLVDAMMDKWVMLKDKDKIDLYFIQLWEEAKKIILPLTFEARDSWINTMVSLWTPSLKVQMKKANRLNARYVVMVWIMEANSGIYQVRDMVQWTQEEVKKENLIEYIISKIGKSGLDFYCPWKDLLLPK
jgi:histidyl-tRNA synthetase